MENVWTSLAKDHENEPGKSAYASKVANMYQQMESDAQQQFTKVGGTWPKEGLSLAQHIKLECPDPKVNWAAAIVEDNQIGSTFSIEVLLQKARHCERFCIKQGQSNNFGPNSTCIGLV